MKETIQIVNTTPIPKKKGRKKKVIPGFRIVMATPDKPIIVSFD